MSADRSCRRRDEALEAELAALAGRLGETPLSLVHRDLQSQNVMVVNGEPVLIDFQGLRPGSFFYDLGSLLFDPYVAFPKGKGPASAVLSGAFRFPRERGAVPGTVCHGLGPAPDAGPGGLRFPRPEAREAPFPGPTFPGPSTTSPPRRRRRAPCRFSTPSPSAAAPPARNSRFRFPLRPWVPADPTTRKSLGLKMVP